MYLYVYYKVADFSEWKAAYDADLPVRQKAGLREISVLPDAGGKNEVVVFFEAKTYEKTKRFAAAADYQLSRAGRVMMAEPIPKRGQKSTWRV
jgi:hypothetical protein